MPNIAQFLRKRDYIVVRELGEGACGKTVLLNDDQIDQKFVCKKYAPFNEGHRKGLYENFVREIKLLHLLYHDNLVRVFNYYLYPEKYAGYILMEYVDGKDIQDFTNESPEKIDSLFTQAIEGFSYLERTGILHRDIRPGNLMVNNDGLLKIIDLGFGKQVNTTLDFDKSVSLNWWCPTPDEFRVEKYDFTTEVYFVGKLFERLIDTNNISHFGYTEVLRKMCQPNPDQRIKSFAEIGREIQGKTISEVNFGFSDIQTYRLFADDLINMTSKISLSSKYITDISKILPKLEDIYRSSMLESSISNAPKIIGCFVEGDYFYKKNYTITTDRVQKFIRLLKSCEPGQIRIIIANLDTRFDTIKTYDPNEIRDDIPF